MDLTSLETLLSEVFGQTLCFVPFVTERHQFLLDESANGSAELDVSFVVERRVPSLIPRGITHWHQFTESVVHHGQLHLLLGGFFGDRWRVLVTNNTNLQVRTIFLQYICVVELIELLASFFARNIDEDLAAT